MDLDILINRTTRLKRIGVSNRMILQNASLEFMDDLLFTMRFLCPLILFYLAYKCGKRIKEVGFVSAMTGFTIYMIGIAFFQFGTLLYTNYPELNALYIPNFDDIPTFPSDFLSIYNISNYVYAAGMVCFIVFTEVNLTKLNQLRYPMQMKFLLSILSVSTLTVLVVLRLLEIVRKGVFFIAQAPPMIIMSWIYLSRFNRLLAVRKKKLVWLFFIGMVIGGFSNFLQGFEETWAYSLNAIVVLIGAFMQEWSWGRIPSLAELNWLLGLKRLIVIKNGSSITLLEQDFDIAKESAPGVITGAAFGGVSQLLKEILASDESVNIIEQGDTMVYFSNQERFTAILITSTKSEEYGYRLNKFAIEFGRKYNDVLKNWEGDINKFQDSKKLVDEIFK